MAEERKRAGDEVVNKEATETGQDASKNSALNEPGASKASMLTAGPIISLVLSGAVILSYIVDAMRMHAFHVPPTVTYASGDGLLSALSNIPTYAILSLLFLVATVIVSLLALLCVTAVVGSVPLLWFLVKCAGMFGVGLGAWTLQSRSSTDTWLSQKFTSYKFASQAVSASGNFSGLLRGLYMSSESASAWETAVGTARTLIHRIFDHSIGLFFTSAKSGTQRVARLIIVVFLLLFPLSGAYAWQFMRIYTVTAPEDRAALRDRVPVPVRLPYDVLSCARTQSDEETNRIDVLLHAKAVLDELATPIFAIIDPRSVLWEEESQSPEPSTMRGRVVEGLCSVVAFALPVIKTSDIFPVVELTIGARHGAEMTRLKFNPTPSDPTRPFRTSRYRYLGDFGEWALLAACNDAENCAAPEPGILIRRANIIEVRRAREESTEPLPPAGNQGQGKDIARAISALSREVKIAISTAASKSVKLHDKRHKDMLERFDTFLSEFASQKAGPPVMVIAQVPASTTSTQNILSFQSTLVIGDRTYRMPVNSIAMPFFVGSPGPSNPKDALAFGANPANFADPLLKPQGEPSRLLKRFAEALAQCLIDQNDGSPTTIEIDVVGLASQSWTEPGNYDRDLLNTYLAEGRRILILRKLADLIDNQKLANIRVVHSGGMSRTLDEIRDHIGSDGTIINDETLNEIARFLPDVLMPAQTREAMLSEARAGFVSSTETAQDTINHIEELYARAVVLTIVGINGGPCRM